MSCALSKHDSILGIICSVSNKKLHVFYCLLLPGLQFKGMRNDLQPAVVSLGISSAHIHDEGSYNMIHGSKGRSDIIHGRSEGKKYS